MTYSDMQQFQTGEETDIGPLVLHKICKGNFYVEEVHKDSILASLKKHA